MHVRIFLSSLHRHIMHFNAIDNAPRNYYTMSHTIMLLAWTSENGQRIMARQGFLLLKLSALDKFYCSIVIHADTHNMVAYVIWRNEFVLNCSTAFVVIGYYRFSIQSAVKLSVVALNSFRTYTNVCVGLFVLYGYVPTSRFPQTNKHCGIISKV